VMFPMLVSMITDGLTFFSSMAAPSDDAAKTNANVMTVNLIIIPIAILSSKRFWLASPEPES
jgi:hypothetical protein